MTRIKLIASDLDGTLLLNDTQELRPDTCDLIRTLHEMGIMFFAASGRQYFNIRQLFEPVNDIIGYICENGAISFNKGVMLGKHTIPHEAGQAIIRAITQREGFEVMISGENTCYIHPKDMSFYYYLHDTVKYNVTIVPDIMNTPEPYMKIAIYQKDGKTDLNYWASLFEGLCYVVTSGTMWVDAMPFGVNKGVALEHVLDVLEISPAECMAIGDNDNDREMLELAGYPVAVNSAKSQIRALAKILTPSVEELFMKIIQGSL